jgi:hypothetical protein
MIRIAALAGACLLMGSTSSARTLDSDLAYTLARNRNPLLTSYTFHMTVAMAMRHFPWLHFHIDGDGQYVRGENYVVHFTRMPFFARGIQQIDLSPLDPSMWQKRFFVTVADRRDGMTTFALRVRRLDPQDPNPLEETFVTLDSQYSTREVVLRYRDGVIRLNITPSNTQRFRLPATGDAGIDMPGQSLSAHAAFTNYTIVQRT